jgi:transposase-like protein
MASVAKGKSNVEAIGAISVEKKGRFQIYQGVREEIAVHVRPAVARILTAALDEEVTTLLKRGRYERVMVGDHAEVEAVCNRCKCRKRAKFRRGGHEKRSLATLYGAVEIRTPRIECECGGLVRFEYLSVQRRARLWYDLKERLQELSAIAVSLRDTIDILAKDIDVGLRTVNEVVNQAADLAEAEQKEPLTDVPPVVLLDGVSHRQMENTGEIKEDSLGRQREVKRGRSGMTLLAYGIWPDEGRKEVLDWEFGWEEDANTAIKLLERLEQRGLRAENGLETVVHDGSPAFIVALGIVDLGDVFDQRCIFHKIGNLEDNLVGLENIDRQERQRLRQEVLKDGSWVYQATTKAGAYKRMGEFCSRWEGQQPKVADTIRRDFEATVSYYDLQARAKSRGQNWPARYLRTTSALERENRSLRHKRRQVGMYQSARGLNASTYLAKERTEHRREKRKGRWTEPFIEQKLAA